MSLRSLRRVLKNKVTQPEYSGMTNVLFHSRSEGLVVGADNDYGTVDGSGNVTVVKSISPAPIGRNFNTNGTPVNLSADGIVIPPAGRLRSPSGSITWANTLHYRATLADLKWTIHGVVKFTTSDNPDATAGLLGNNANSTNNKGINIFLDDRSSQSRNNALIVQITRGVNLSFVCAGGNTNILQPNVFLDLWIQYDKSLDQTYQLQAKINGQPMVMENKIDSDTVVTTPSFEMEIGGCGNGTASGGLTYKELTVQNGVQSESFWQQFITARMFKYSITPNPLVVDGIQMITDFDLYDTLDDGTYKLTCHLCQNPLNPDTIVALFTDGSQHTAEANKHVARRGSTNKGRIFSSKTTVFNPVGNWCVQDIGAGYDSNGRLHLISDVWDATDATIPGQIWHSWSDDDGVTWTDTNISSSIPSDGLVQSKIYGSIKQTGDVLACPLYRTDLATGGTTSTRYLLRITDFDTVPVYQFVVMETTDPIYRNETDILWITPTYGIAMVRDEVTLMLYQQHTEDAGLTWLVDGAVTFGETFTKAAPVRLKKFILEGVEIVACYFSDRDRDLFKVIYAKASDFATLEQNAWDISTKFTIHQGSNNEHLHYGDVCHTNNDFEAIAMYVIDSFPNIGGTVNIMYTFKIPTFHYPFVKAKFGI